MLRSPVLLLIYWFVHQFAPLLVAPQRIWAEEGSKVFSSSDGSLKITYAERIPAKPVATKLGLILLFHGGTLNESSLLSATLGPLEQAGVGNHYILVGLKSIGSGWDTRDDAPVTAFIQHALTHYPIDRRRIIGMGYSAGCYYITRFAQEHPEFFAGAVGYVGSQSGGPSKEAASKVTGLYWVTGHKDQLQPVQEPRAQALRNIALGLPVVYHEDRDMEHNFLWGQTGLDAIAWMQPLRAKAAPLEADDSEFIASFSDDAKITKLLGDTKTWMRVVNISGPQVAPVLLAGLRSDKPTVQTNAATACSKVMVTDEIVNELAKLLAGKDKKLKASALTALIPHASWNHPLAQQVLCGAALNSATALSDRRALVLALAQVVKLDLLGGFVYQRPLWALVDLLDDDDAMLRHGAFQALEPALTGGFAYQPGASKAARSAAVEQWRGWVEKRCGPRPAW